MRSDQEKWLSRLQKVENNISRVDKRVNLSSLACIFDGYMRIIPVVYVQMKTLEYLNMRLPRPRWTVHALIEIVVRILSRIRHWLIAGWTSRWSRLRTSIVLLLRGDLSGLRHALVFVLNVRLRLTLLWRWLLLVLSWLIGVLLLTTRRSHRGSNLWCGRCSWLILLGLLLLWCTSIESSDRLMLLRQIIGAFVIPDRSVRSSLLRLHSYTCNRRWIGCKLRWWSSCYGYSRGRIITILWRSLRLRCRVAVGVEIILTIATSIFNVMCGHLIINR